MKHLLILAASLGLSAFAQGAGWTYKLWKDPMNDHQTHAVYRLASEPVQCAYSQSMPILSVEWSPGPGKPGIGVYAGCVLDTRRGETMVLIRWDDAQPTSVKAWPTGSTGQSLLLSGVTLQDLLTHRRLRVELPVYKSRAVGDFTLDGLSAALKPMLADGLQITP